MQIRIDAEPVGPVKVIPTLPSARLSVLEGLNGIGKTLSVRLLQICSGKMPYQTESAAWESLCRSLGKFRVSVSGLSGVSRIEWVADSREWLAHSSVDGLLPFKRIEIDGTRASLSEVGQHFGVYRLAGDETLIETLAQQADIAQGAVKRWTRNTAGTSTGPLSRLEELAGDVLRSLGEWTGDGYAKLLRTIERDEERLMVANREAESAASTLRRLETAVELRQRRDQLRRIAPDLRERAAAIDEEIAEIRPEIDQVQKEIVRLAKDSARKEPVQRELRNAQRTLRRNQSNLSRALSSAASVAVELELEPTREASKATTRRLEQEVSDLTRRQLALDAAPAMRDLLDEMLDILSRGETRGLADQIALDDPETDLQLSVTETRVGVATRRRQLEDQPPAPEARAVAEQLEAARDRLKRTAQLAKHLKEVARYRRLVAKNEDRVDRALSAADPGALAALQELEVKRRKLDGALLRLAAERAAVRQQLGSIGSEPLQVVEARLKQALDELGMDGEALPEAVETARASEHSARVIHSQVQQQLNTLRRDAARAEADVRRVLGAFRAPGDLEWLHLPSPAVSSEHVPLSSQLTKLDRIRGRLEAVVERLGTHRTQLEAVGTGLRGVARHLRGEDPEAIEYVSELERWFGSHFSSWFNTKSVRAELLPAADDGIKVDVHRREVSWIENGRARSRPLEAFSSGEQAFAYTRARLAALDEEVAKVPNRLIVLDEFGAFIAHDRLSGLLSYLKARVTDHPEDQVLVILPLSHDYASEAENSVGRQKEDLRRLADEIAERQFAVRVLAE